MVDALRLVKKW